MKEGYGLLEKVARHGMEELLPIWEEIKERKKCANATLAIAGSIFIQVMFVGLYKIPVIVGYVLLIFSVAMACHYRGRNEESHNRIMKLWEQLTEI